MTLRKKIGIALLAVPVVLIVAAAALYFLNELLGRQEIRDFRAQRGLASENSHYDLDDVMSYLNRKFPPGTPKNLVREEFKDCHQIDSVPQYGLESYTYNIGLGGWLEINANYDSLGKVTQFGYDLRFHKYDY